MRRFVVFLLTLSLVTLPAGLRAQTAGLPQWTGCHEEAQITQSGNVISCVYDEKYLYQKFTYYVTSIGGAHVCRITVVELRHQKLGKEVATKSGLRDADSLRHFYRTEYSNRITTTNEKGHELTTFIDVLSGPNGIKIETMTLLPITAGPKLEGDVPVQEVHF